MGFYQADNLVAVAMYQHWHETWSNWPRSLPMRDQYCCKAYRCRFSFWLSSSAHRFAFLPYPAACLPCASRVLLGVARAYPKRPWTYWLSPLCDLPVALRILRCALSHRHIWRNRTYVRRKGGMFEPLA